MAAIEVAVGGEMALDIVGVPVSAVMTVPVYRVNELDDVEGRISDAAGDQVEGLAAIRVAVMVACVLGSASLIPEQSVYDVHSSSGVGEHADTTQRRAASPSVKPVVVLVEQRQSMSCVFEQS